MARDVAFDREGNAYLAGGTRSSDFPTTDGSTLQGPSDAFVTRIDRTGVVRWSRLIGGPGYDRVYGMEVGPDGTVYIAGRAGPGLPVTAGALQTTFAGGREPGALYGEQDGFICRLRAEDGAIMFCTWFGNEDYVPIRDIAVDHAGDLYIVSSGDNDSFPAAWFMGSFQPARAGRRDLLLAKVRGDGSAVEWATWLGGSDVEGNTNSVRVDDSGVYVAMFTRSPDLPATGFGLSRKGANDVYVAKLTLDGSRLLWGNYVGGSGREDTETHQLAVAPDGTVYVAGPTTSPDFPVTSGITGRLNTGSVGAHSPDAFVAAIAPDGSHLGAATVIGGSRGDVAEGIAVDSAGLVYLTGGTVSSDFPGLPGSLGMNDVWAAVLPPTLDRFIATARLGGARKDRGRCAAVDPTGRLAICGHSASRPGTALLRQHPARSGDDDALIVIFAPVP